MSRRYKQVVAGLCAALASQAAWAQDESSYDTLIQQGQYWQDRNDDKRAAEAWNKLLLISPQNPQALYGLATIDLKANRLDSAKAYLAKLRAAHPNSSLVSRLDEEIALGTGANRTVLEQAQTQAASGELEQAVSKYRQVLGDREPAGRLGREYYTYLGYTPGGLSEAISGLQRLATESPNDSQIALALARHMARDEKQRLEGVRRLSQLSSNAEVGQEATKSWREALTWFGSPGTPQQRTLLADYVKKFPDDTGIQNQLREAESLARRSAESARVAAQAPVRVDPLRQQTDAAMRSLDQGDMASAEAAFLDALKKRPNDSQALGGLGVLRMRQGNMKEARDLLTRARRGNASWQPALQSAQYWESLERASNLYERGDLAGARRALQSVSRLQPNEVAADLLFADILAKEGKFSQAETSYRAVLKKQPNNTKALTGLVNVLVQDNKLDQAQKLMASVPSSSANDMASARAVYAQGVARAARASGDTATAQRALEDALSYDPSNVWVRLELAQQYQNAGYKKEAHGLLEGLLASDPNNPDVLFAAATFANENQDWRGAQTLLQQIPQQNQTPAMRRLQESSARQLYVQQAGYLADQGRKQEALQMLSQAEAAAGGDIGFIGGIAETYAKLGEPARGLALLRPALSSSSGPDRVDASLAYAGMLLRMNQDVEAAAVIRNLQQEKLSSRQASALDELAGVYTVRQADALRERGDLVSAYDMLEPVLARNPNDVQALGALARMYAAAGDNGQAMGLFDRAIQQDPDNAELYLGAAHAAQAAQNKGYAARQAEMAVSLAPDRVDVLTDAARIYRAQGKTREAANLLERAAALQAPAAYMAPGMPAYGGGAATAVQGRNPFAGLPGQRPAATSGIMPPPQYAASSGGFPIGQPIQAPTHSQSPMQLPDYRQPVQQQAMPVYPVPGAAGQASRSVAAPLPTSPSGGYAPPTGGAYYAPVQAGGATAMAPGWQPGYAGQSLSPLALELEKVQEERSGEIRAGALFRSRSGASGTSKLSEVQMPVELLLPAGNGKVSIQVTPTILNSGSLGGGLYERATFGDMINIQPWQFNTVPKTKDPAGVGLAVGYETQGFKGDIGTTPLGFQQTNLVGGLLFDGTLDDAGTLGYRFDLSRRPVTDSVLSFAGTEDSRTGAKWGGVTATGARVTLVKDIGDAGIYGTAGWHYLEGKNVESNRRSEFNVGAYVHFINEPDTRLTAGANVNATFYNKNLSQFTYGHGGYFSPQNYYAFGVPFTFAQRDGNFTYRIDGSLGLQQYKTKDAPIYPTSSAMQAAAARELAASTAPELQDLTSGYYRGSSKTSVAYSLSAAAEYKFSPNIVLGAKMATDNVSNYREWNAGLYMRYFFYPQRSSLMDMPVEPYASPYGGTYGR